MVEQGFVDTGELDLVRMRRDRHAKLVAELDHSGAAGALLLGQTNIAYALGAVAQAADHARAAHQRMVAVVPSDGSAPHLFTAFPEGAPPELPPDHVHPQQSVEWPEPCRDLVAVLPDGPIAVDEYTMPLRAALDGREVTNATLLLGACKVTKTDDELECIRRAQSINERAMLDVEPLVTPGRYSKELSARFLHRIFQLGASSNTVDPIFQPMPERIVDGPFSATGDLVFPVPTDDRHLVEGEVIFVDTGLNYRGYQSDFGRTWCVGGAPTPRQRDQFRRWRDVIDRVLEVIKPGATAADLTRAAGRPDGGTPWLPHLYLAHGTGTDSAEPPFVGTDLGPEFDASVVLEPGMVLVLEPVIWDDGEGGYRAEEIVAVTETGHRMLSDHHYAPYG
jgi:Xaa-Pro aminopeptidase